MMTAFGVGFIFARAVFGNLPDKIGGYRVALWSLIVEALGQVTVWGAPHEIVALTGALVTGLGCALVYPALGVEALKRVLPANRGSAMGAFSAFLDVAYGLAGPVAGLIAGRFAMLPSTYSAPPAPFLVRRWSSASAGPEAGRH
jgi:MFS family permease